MSFVTCLEIKAAYAQKSITIASKESFQKPSQTDRGLRPHALSLHLRRRLAHWLRACLERNVLVTYLTLALKAIAVDL